MKNLFTIVIAAFISLCSFSQIYDVAEGYELYQNEARLENKFMTISIEDARTSKKEVYLKLVITNRSDSLLLLKNEEFKFKINGLIYSLGERTKTIQPKDIQSVRLEIQSKDSYALKTEPTGETSKVPGESSFAVKSFQFLPNGIYFVSPQETKFKGDNSVFEVPNGEKEISTNDFMTCKLTEKEAEKKEFEGRIICEYIGRNVIIWDESATNISSRTPSDNDLFTVHKPEPDIEKRILFPEKKAALNFGCEMDKKGEFRFDGATMLVDMKNVITHATLNPCFTTEEWILLEFDEEKTVKKNDVLDPALIR